MVFVIYFLSIMNTSYEYGLCPILEDSTFVFKTFNFWLQNKKQFLKRNCLSIIIFNNYHLMLEIEDQK